MRDERDRRIEDLQFQLAEMTHLAAHYKIIAERRNRSEVEAWRECRRLEAQMRRMMHHD